MLSDNLRMIEPVARIVEPKILSHFVYVSSDAVYKDSSGLLNEESCAEPASLHGIMHLSREIIMKEACNDIPLMIVRPSLLYGSNDAALARAGGVGGRSRGHSGAAWNLGLRGI